MVYFFSVILLVIVCNLVGKADIRANESDAAQPTRAIRPASCGLVTPDVNYFGLVLTWLLRLFHNN